MIEPSDQERAELPECSAQYMADLEAEVGRLREDIQYALDRLSVTVDQKPGLRALIDKATGDGDFFPAYELDRRKEQLQGVNHALGDQINLNKELLIEVERLRAEATVRNAEFSRRIDAAQALLSQAELKRDQLQAIVDKLPKDHEGEPIVPGEHRWINEVVPEHRWHPGGERCVQEVVVDGIGNNHDVLVGGLPGVDDDQWEVCADDLYNTHEAAEAERKTDAD